MAGENKTGTFVLLDDSAGRKYVAETGLIGGDFPNHKTVMTFSGERELKDGANELVVKFESPEKSGVKLVKTYTFKRGAYDASVRHEVVNTGTAPVAAAAVPAARARRQQAARRVVVLFAPSPARRSTPRPRSSRRSSSATSTRTRPTSTRKSTNGYVAMVQHYFASAWILPDGVKRELFVRKVDANLYAVGMIAPLDADRARRDQGGGRQVLRRPAGGKACSRTIAPGLELVKDYGWLTILAKPLYWLLDQIHSFLHNWGWSIMALVLVIKIAFYWLQAKGYESMAKMKAINPKVMAMRERFKDNPQQMQQEMMRIYREEKVNPMGGCFPIMVQIPVFIALYWVLLSSVEMRGAPWIGWIHDLSAPDPYYILPVVMTLTTHAADGAQPGAAGPDAGQDDVVHAAGLQRDVLLLPGRPGAVLDHQQRAVDRPAVADQHAHGRAAAVQPAEVQVDGCQCRQGPQCKGRASGPCPL